MGFDDRAYARDENSGQWFGRDWSVVTWIIVMNLGIYVLQILLRKNDDPLTQFLALRADLFTFELLTHPWRIAELVTYGFAHDPDNILHIAFNMFFFWMFGRELEARYGGPNFVKIYFTGLVVAGLGWMLVDNLTYGVREKAMLYGASGGVSTVIALFVLLYPKRTVLFWGLFPMPIWVFGLIWLFGDIQGAVLRTGNVAFTAHLAGAGYGLLFYYTSWTLGSLWPSGMNLTLKRMRGPKLKVHDPEEAEESMAEQVDRILEKIQTHGQESLTAKEREILEQASRRYQQKHR